MGRVVTKIPATRFNVKKVKETNKKKVAGYARVSTDKDEQLTSYNAQLDYYMNYINRRADWEFVEVYADEGISGTNTRHRKGFNRMIEDALDGKIDLIITKSVSRFARNTVDSLTTVRKLKERNVEVYFEKENIWTLDSKGELLITIMSSLAQEESRSISENVKWGKRKAFQDGKVTVGYSTFIGYDKGKDGGLVINEEQAKIVKKIYRLFLEGKSITRITKILEDEGIRTPANKTKWRYATVKRILSNEKYKGDALLQKTYRPDFLDKKQLVNNGEVPQFYVKDNHEAIIEEYVWDFVQQKLKLNNNKTKIFTDRIVCDNCGSYFGSKTWHSTSKYKRKVWQCNGKYKSNDKCSSTHLYEKDIKKKFIEELNILIKNRNKVIKDIEEIKDKIFDTSKLEDESDKYIKQLDKISSDIRKAVRNETKYDELVEEYESIKTKYENIEIKIEDKQSRKKELEYFTKVLQDCVVNKFDDFTFNILVKEIRVDDGIKIKWNM